MAFFAQLPPKVTPESQVAQGLSQGLQNVAPLYQQQYQRGMLQNALGDIRNLSQQGNVRPIDLMTHMIQATAGIPGSEKYLSTLMPYMVGQAQTQALYGQQPTGGQGGLTPQQQTDQALNATTTNASSPRPEDIAPGLTPPGQKQQAGFLQPIRTPQEIDQASSAAANIMGDPTKKQYFMEQMNYQNELALNARKLLGDKAIQTGRIKEKDLPIFFQKAQNYSHVTDPDELALSAARDTQKYNEVVSSVEKANIPGLGRTLGWGALGPIGLLGKFALGGRSREDAIKSLQPIVEEAKEAGEEFTVRNKLAELGLSPTEIEETVFPLPEKTINAINSFPNAEKAPEKIRKQKLVNFFKNNIEPDTSLLVLRHKLWNEKGYDWKEIAPAVNMAVEEKRKQNPKFDLSAQQKAELGALGNDPPMQSLSDMFSSWHTWIGAMRGAK